MVVAALEVVAGAAVVDAAVSGAGVAACVAGGADNQEESTTKDKLCIQVRRVSWRAVFTKLTTVHVNAVGTAIIVTEAIAVP